MGVECRSGGPTQVIVTFANPVTVDGSTTPSLSAATVTGTGSVGSIMVTGAVVTVNLTGVADVRRITLTLSNVSDGVSGGNVAVPIGVLLGDTNNNGSVCNSDVSQTKAQASVAAPVTAANFRTDVNASGGTVSNSDISLVKSKSGNSLPPP